MAQFPPPYPFPLPQNAQQQSAAAAANLYSLTDANNETHSIDAVVDRVHALASAIHDLAQSAGGNVQGIGARGEQSVAQFDTKFGVIQSDVQRILLNANARVEQVPVPALVGVGVCLVVLLVLVGLWLLSTVAERRVQRRRARHIGEEAMDGWKDSRTADEL
uniref:Uncharacterized protein n=1 Tax=Globodera rostochiensis TaxID=31243 RepID=A0A914HHT9_GLORO